MATEVPTSLILPGGSHVIFRELCSGQLSALPFSSAFEVVVEQSVTLMGEKRKCFFYFYPLYFWPSSP